MGADFPRRAKKTFDKSWDQARVQLCTADLFTQQPACAGQSAAFELLGDASLKAGDLVTVEKEGSDLVARRCLTPVARAVKPPIDMLKAFEDSCEIAQGTVHLIHSAAGVAEIGLC